MSQMVPLECPKCHHKWSMDYQQLQEFKDIYKTIDPAGSSATAAGGTAEEGVRREEYRLRCPNPAHGEDVIVTLRITGTDD